MRKALAAPALVAVAIGLVVFGGDDEPSGPSHYSIFDRPAEPRDRAPQDPSAGGLRTEEQTGKLRAVGEMRRYRFYLSRDSTGMCRFHHNLDDGATASGCSPRPADFRAGTAFEADGTAIAFVAVPDGYTKAKVVSGRVLEDRMMPNGYAVAFEKDPIVVRFEGSRGEREVKIRGW